MNANRKKILHREDIFSTKTIRFGKQLATRKTHIIKFYLECGHVVMRQPHQISGTVKSTICEWCNSGEEPQEGN
jgi:hypothetical protein